MRSRRTSLSERWVRSPKLTTVFSNDRSEGQILYHGRLEEDLKETSMSTHRRRTIYIYIFELQGTFCFNYKLNSCSGQLICPRDEPAIFAAKKRVLSEAEGVTKKPVDGSVLSNGPIFQSCGFSPSGRFLACSDPTQIQLPRPTKLALMSPASPPNSTPSAAASTVSDQFGAIWSPFKRSQVMGDLERGDETPVIWIKIPCQLKIVILDLPAPPWFI